MKTSVIGIDLSKNVFHIVAINHRGKVLLKKKTSRSKFLELIVQFEKDVLICMETCQGSHEWCRRLREMGYRAEQIAAQHVKKYTSHQKNDYNDAQAIAEAGSRAETKFVAVKTREQQELDAAQVVRSRYVRNRTALMNQMRGILAEQGLVLPQGRLSLVNYIGSEMSQVSMPIRELLSEMYEELQMLDDKVKAIEKMLKRRADACPTVRRLRTIPGIGLFAGVALTTLSGCPKNFKNGRQFAANLGIVPRQVSSGGKTKLLGITKHGDREMRSLLIIGAQSVIQQAVSKKRTDPHSLWIRKLYEKKGAKLTAVALANKNARIAWRILTTPGLEYQPSLSHKELAVS